MVNTQKKTAEKRRFLVLIPHRDAAILFNEYRQKLFSMGIPGAHSFPTAAPLAELSQPLSREELRELAVKVREQTNKNNGIIQCSGTVTTGCADKNFKELTFYGLKLSLESVNGLIPGAAKGKISSFLAPPILPSFVGCRDDPCAAEKKLAAAPSLAFRAAALANLIIRPLYAETPNYSFEWKISEPVWLPAYKKA